MKRSLLFLVALLSWTGLAAQAQPQPGKASSPDFDTFFENATLRLDYVFCGDATHQEVFVQQACRTPEWAGRRQHLDEVLLRGNGQVVVRRASDAKVLYVNSFSTLFQEWQCTEEAKRLQRAFDRLNLIFRETEDLYNRSVLTEELSELRNLIACAYLIIKMARARRENVGLHYSIDLVR